MSSIFDFELGLWNAWIIIVLGFVLPNITSFLLPQVNKDTMSKRMGKFKWSAFDRTFKMIIVITQVIIMPFTIIYSFFLPVKLGTVGFYVGLPVSVLGIVMPFIAQISFATAPLDKPLTTGAYRISRNPEYFSVFLQYLGIGIACLSWVFVVCAVTWIVLFHIEVVRYEEPFLIERYGDAYKEYMNRTQRWIGIIESKKKD